VFNVKRGFSEVTSTHITTAKAFIYSAPFLSTASFVFLSILAFTQTIFLKHHCQVF